MKKKKLGLAIGASVAASASLLAATSSERYVYDASGNIIEKQIGDQVTQFDYAGNLLKGSLLNAAQKEYQYDGAGRLVGELEEGQVVRKLDYQFADKVTKVQNREETTELFYNAEGQLVGINSAGNLEALAWDGLAMVSRGAQAYANEEHVVGGVPTLIGNDVSVCDVIGNTLSVGNQSFEASAYGEGLENGLLTGKPFIFEINSFVFNYRNYNNEILRWGAVDPSGFPDGENNYLYVKNSPLTLVDPLGLAACTPLYMVDWTDPVPFAPEGNLKAKRRFEFTFSSPPKAKGDFVKVSGSTANWALYDKIDLYIKKGYTAQDPVNCPDAAYHKRKYLNGEWELTGEYTSQRSVSHQTNQWTDHATLDVAAEK